MSTRAVRTGESADPKDVGRRKEYSLRATWQSATGDRGRLAFWLFCSILACLFMLGPRLLSLAYGFIDPSFNYAVDLAGAQKLAFGTSFIATYGPLGYLAANYLPDLAVRVECWLVFYALFTGLGVFLFATRYIAGGWRKWAAAAILLYALGMTPGGFIEWQYFLVFLLYCFVYLRGTFRERWWIAGSLTVLAAIFLFTKFTLGVGSALTLFLLVGFVPLSPRKYRVWPLLSVALAYAAVVLILAKLLGVSSMSAYAKTGFIVSDKFSSAMAWCAPHTAVATILIFGCLAGIGVWVLWTERRKAYRYFFIAPALLLVWKYCVARQDGHILAVLPVAIPLAFLYYFAGSRSRTAGSKDKAVLTVIVAAACAAVWANGIQFSGSSSFWSFVGAPAGNVVHGSIVSFFDLGRQKNEWAAETAVQLHSAVLPESMTQTIGTGGVDVFPWETSIIAANKLHWQPRPSPFSFETYDPSLDNLNASFFASGKAPAYIVWHSTGNGVYGVDQRNVLWDEPATLRAILANYQLKSSNNNFMLLQKRSHPVKLAVSTVREPQGLIASAAWMPVPNVPAGKLQFLQFTVRQSIRNKLKETLLRGDAYSLQLKTQSGAIETYRFVKDNSGQGLLVNPLPANWQQLVLMMQNHTFDNANDRIVAFQLTRQQ